MFPLHLKYLHDPNIMWFNPCWGYFGFWKKIAEFQKEYGVDFQTAWNHGGMKKSKEKYALAMAAMCMKKAALGKEVWWFAKTLQDPPDGIIGTVKKDKKTGGNIMSVREVEVVEHFEGDLLKTIQNKLKKRYERNTFLVCLLSPKDIVEYNFLEISKKLKTMSLSLENIFVVFHGFKILTKEWGVLDEKEKIKEMSKVVLIQLVPEYKEIDILPSSFCKSFLEGSEGAWLNFTKRGLEGGFENKTLMEAPILFD